MSHFTVLVIGDKVEEQLQPYHEYECTGIMDQYVVALDETEENIKDYQTDTVAIVFKDGKLFGTKYSDQCKGFWKRSGIGISSNDEFILPIGSGFSLQEDYPLNQVYPTFAQYMKDWHGEDLNKDGRVVRHTNPNAKWDWWVIGGRWTGFFTLKPGTTGEQGKPGLMTPSAGARCCDSTIKKNIDFASMRMTKQLEAQAAWESVNSIITKSEVFRTWDEVTEKKNYGGEQREIYNSQPEVQAFRSINNLPWDDKVEDYLIPKEEYVQKYVDTTAVTFAVVKDGQWYEKGKMGWWANVSDAKEQGEWNKEFWSLIDSLPEDTLLTVVDCHI